MFDRLLHPLFGITLVGALAACSFDEGAIGGTGVGGDGTSGPGGSPPGSNAGGSEDLGSDGDVTLLDNGGSPGGAGPGGAGSGGGGGGANNQDLLPPACAPLENAPGVAFALGPSDSHSTGSAAYAHELLGDCRAPAPGMLETSHFVNLHDLGYAHLDGELGAYLHLLPTDDPHLLILQGAAVAGLDPARSEVHLTFVVDTSGSTEEGAMARQVAALEATKSMLVSGDTIAIYGWSADAVLEPTDGADQNAIQAAIDTLAGGDLDGALAQGLSAAVGTAMTRVGADGEHTLVVMTDGGEQLTDDIKSALVAVASESRLGFLGVGVGPAADYSPALVREMTSVAGGKMHYVGTGAGFDAQSLFGDGFQRMFNVAAQTATLAVAMPAFFEVVKAPDDVYVGDETVLRQRTLAPGGTILFRQTIRVCDPDILDMQIPSIAGTVTFDRPALGAPEGATTFMADAYVAFPQSIAVNTPNPAASTEALVTFADALRGPVSARLQEASSFIEGASEADPGLRDQLSDLLKRHPNHPATECAP